METLIDFTVTTPRSDMETYTNPHTGETINLRQRIHNPSLWEMVRNGEWIGAADYHHILNAKLTRNGYLPMD